MYIIRLPTVVAIAVVAKVLTHKVVLSRRYYNICSSVC
jgi:hypothetical protein